MRLLKQVSDRLGPGARQAGVLVAWSGGLDSTVLVDLVRRWAARTGAEMATVHVDHRLRSSSASDAAFCRRTATRWGVPLVVERLDIRRRGSAQESARLQRYAAIARAACELDLGVVVTAHHADDALETALINFRHGTASGGLSSLVGGAEAPLPSWPDLRLVRPLVEVAREDLRSYAEELGLAWRVDPTNRDVGYERNRLRRDALPVLTDDGQKLDAHITTLKNLASEDEALRELAARCLERARLEPPDGETVALARKPLEDAPAAVAAHALRRAAYRLPAETGLRRIHVEEALEAIERDQTTRLSIPGARLIVERGLVLIELARGRGGRHLNERLAEPIDIELTAESGSIPWFGTMISWRRLEGDEEPRDGSALTAYLEAEAGVRNLFVRGPRAADRLDASGLDGHKAIGELLGEAGAPRSIRWRWPCLIAADAPGAPLWVCGIRRSESAVSDAPTVEVRWEVESETVFGAILRGFSGM